MLVSAAVPVPAGEINWNPGSGEAVLEGDTYPSGTLIDAAIDCEGRPSRPGRRWRIGHCSGCRNAPPRLIITSSILLDKELICELMIPSCELMIPSCELMIPSCELIAPICELIPPICELIPPICELSVLIWDVVARPSPAAVLVARLPEASEVTICVGPVCAARLAAEMIPGIV